MRLSKRIDKKKLLKAFAIFFSVILSVLFLIFAAFYNDSGRKFIIDYIVSYLQSENFSLKVEGANEKLTHVDKVSVKFSDNFLEIYNVDFERDGLFSRPRVQVKKAVYQAHDEKSKKKPAEKINSVVDKKLPGKKEIAAVGDPDSGSLNSDDGTTDNGSGFDLKTPLSYVKKISLFVESLKVAEIEVFVGDVKRKYENFEYKSEGGRDSVSMKSVSVKTNPPQFNFVLDWSNSGNLTGDFRNIEGFSCNMRMNSLESSEPKYEVEIGNSEYKINADGYFSDRMNTLLISKGVIQCCGKKLDFHGKVLLNKNRADLVTKLSLSNFMDTSKIPTEITENFQDILTNISVEKKEKSIKSHIEFKKENRKLGNCEIVLQGKNLSAKSDVSWINFWGHKLRTIDVYSKNLKNFDVNVAGTDVFGDDFKISSEVVCGKNIGIQRLVCELKKGKITLIKPFVLDKRNLDTSFNFDLKSLGFFQKYFKVKGVTGDVFFKNGLLGVDAKIDQILNENYEMYNGKISGDLNDLKIDVGRAKVMGNMLKSLILKKKNNSLSLTAKLNNNSKIILDGTFVDDISSFSGNIKNKNAELKLRNCVADLKGRLYKIYSEITENKKSGTLQILASPNKIEVIAKDVSVQDLGKAFDKVLPQCFVNGNLKLSPSQDCFSGTGHFKMEELISRRSTIDVDLKQDQKGLFVRGNLSNATDNLRLEILIPVFIKRNLDFLVRNDSPVKASLRGEAHVENIFEFPDGINIKGKIKSDLNISGSTDYPRIQGNVECSNALIFISDVVLKNGVIKLTGQDRKFIVHDSYFVDSYGKKAKIRGDAGLFFSHGIPNLNTNLQLEFDNFRLFDTDSMKINISGNGAMTGPIDNLKLSGDLKVPLCKLIFSESADEDKYKDITITNDLFLSKAKKQEDDFFLYDVNLYGPIIKIIGNIYQLECGGNLHLGTYDRKATLSGSVDLKNGKLNLFGKRMIFEKSKIEFLENYPFDPKMKISCSRDVDTMKVVLDVKNSPGEGMSLDLHSHPNHTQDDILSHMMFGKSSKDLSVGEAAQLAHAINSMKQKGYIFSILNTFQNIGLVDSLSFSTNNNNSSSLYKNSQSSSDKLNIRAGKYLSDDVYISVNQKEEETSFDVDLSVGSNTSLKVNTLGEVGVSWKFRY